MIDVLDLAKYVIYIGNEKDVLVTNLKLQKILYYIGGAYAGAFSKPLFDARIEAWQFGPVVRRAYVEYCSSGPLPLYVSDEKPVLNCDKKEMSLIDFIIGEKIEKTGGEMINSSHQEAPWKNHKEHIAEKPTISFEELEDYFKDSDEVKKWMKNQND